MLSEEAFELKEVGLCDLVLQDLEPDREVSSCMGIKCHEKPYQLFPIVSHSSVRRARDSSERES